MKQRLVILLLVLALGLVACGLQTPSQPAANFPTDPRYIHLLLPSGVTATPDLSTPSPMPTFSPPSAEQPVHVSSLRLDQGLRTPIGTTYWVTPSQPIAATFSFYNGTMRERPLILFCLDNFQQVPCRPNETTIALNLQSGESRDVPLEFPSLTPGMHKLRVKAISHIPVPKAFTEKPEVFGDFIIASERLFWDGKVTAYAGSYATPTPPLTSFPTTPAQPLFRGTLYFALTDRNVNDVSKGLPIPNLLPVEGQFGQVIQVKPGEQLMFNLIGGASESATYYQVAQQLNLDLDISSLPYVVTAFIDTQQVALNPSLPVGPVFGTIAREQAVIIPVALTAPSQPGLYSFFVMYEDAPFFRGGELIPQPDGGLLYQHYADFSQSRITRRVVFEVVP